MDKVNSEASAVGNIGLPALIGGQLPTRADRLGLGVEERVGFVDPFLDSSERSWNPLLTVFGH